MVFIYVIRGHSSGLVQFPAGEAVKICFASVSSGIRAMCPNRDRRYFVVVVVSKNIKNHGNYGFTKMLCFSQNVDLRFYKNPNQQNFKFIV